MKQMESLSSIRTALMNDSVAKEICKENNIGTWFLESVPIRYEDLDVTAKTVNGNIILNNYETKNKHKKIRYKLQDGENIIEITAVSLGISPPNTSRIELVDSKIKYPIISQLEIGKTAIIKVIK